jgi:GT2 family glycosyltransferase
MPSSPDTISVVITTFERPDECERALRSVLEQTDPALEVLVCDNGSTDDTAERMREWELREERVRYLRTSHNSGTPASTRNLGVEHAAGSLIAFLDDDDEWLPGKLAAQRAALAAQGVDIVAANALRSDGSLYFRSAPPAWRPTRLDMLRANPIITSSAVVRREALLAVGGFPTQHSLRGFEDYASWLELARRGYSCVVIGEALIRYEDVAADRLSIHRARIQVGVARLVWSHAVCTPTSLGAIRAALRQSIGAAHTLGADAVAALRARGGAAS